MIFDIIKKALSKTHTADTISISYNDNNAREASSIKAEESTFRASLDYENVSISDYDVLVLWWISKKKKGYDYSSQKYPKWFREMYQIDFDTTAKEYIARGYLSLDDNIVKILPSGEDEIKQKEYIIYMHEHPQYRLSIGDFDKSIGVSKKRYNDIAWGIFNSRSIAYVQKQMWKNLEINYSNMANLLIEEKKYNEALDFIFATAFLETSGMGDENELTPIMDDYVSGKWIYLSNGMPDIFLMEINNYYVTAPFLEVNKAVNYNWETIKDKYVNSPIVNSLDTILPFKYFEKEESFIIFREAIEAEEKKGAFPLSAVKTRVKVNVPNENSKTYFYASVRNKVNRKFNL